MSNTRLECIPKEAYRMLNASVIEQYLYQFLFPVLAVLGVVSNSLNMLVLTVKRMSRAYTLFFLLALSDVIFFATLIPSWLASYGAIAENLTFRQLFFAVNINLTGIANWQSAFNNWVVAFISVERYIAVRHPMKIERLLGSTIWGRLMVFAMLTLLCTGHIHFSTTCMVEYVCNGTQMFQACADITLGKTPMGLPNNASEMRLLLIQMDRVIHASIGISLPLLIIIIFNLLLIHHASVGGFAFRGTEHTRNVHTSGQAERSRRHSSGNQLRVEKQLTRIAIVIISVFVLTNVPSAIVLIIQSHFPTNHISLGDAEILSYYAQLACTFITMCGKAANFFIFCYFSKNFRKRLRNRIFCGALATTSTEAASRQSTRRFNL